MDRQLGFDGDLVKRSCFAVFSVAEQAQHDLGGLLRLLIGELFNGRHWWEGAVPDEGLVGKTDEGDVFVDLKLLLTRELDGIHCDVIVEAEYGRWFSFEGQELGHGFFCAFCGEIAGCHKAGIEF